jgi:hypothetical protein
MRRAKTYSSVFRFHENKVINLVYYIVYFNINYITIHLPHANDPGLGSF